MGDSLLGKYWHWRIVLIVSTDTTILTDSTRKFVTVRIFYFIVKNLQAELITNARD